ncbi:MAG: hypothetical protein QGI76_11425 [Dehalococcoidia bacterium]|nr:hypothetical protein [Dehalococcoidia bacterium]
MFFFLLGSRLRILFGLRLWGFRRRGYAVGRAVFFIFDLIFRFGLGFVAQSVWRLIEGLFGHAEGVDRCGHSTVEDHLGDDLRNLFTGDANVQRAGDVPLDHLRTVTQHHQGRDGAEAAGFQVHGRAVVDLAVDDRVHQAHDLRRQFGHGRRRHGVIVRTVIALPEI